MDRKKILLLTLLLTPLWIFSQEQLDHEKKIYQSPEGKLFINKDLPVYLSISTSPDEDGKSFQLKSEDSEEYTNPMYFDTEGINTIRSPWKVDPETKKPVYPQEDIIFEIYADSKAPKTEISFETDNINKADNKIFIGEKTTIRFEKYDALSGVNEIYYSINEAPYKKYNEPINIEEEKEYKIKYYGVDNVGNAEEPNESHIVLDLTPPETSHKIEGDKHENVLSGRSEIKLVSEDKLSEIKETYYTIDEGKKKTYSASIKAKYLEEGEHTITYYSTDHVKNEEKEKTFEFYVDKTPPRVVEELMGNTYVAQGKEYLSGRNKLKIISMDNKAGVKEVRYSVNEGAFEVYDKPFRLSASGRLKIQTLAIDNVNNKKRTEILSNKSGRSHVDLSGPNINHSFDGPAFTSKDTVFITKDTKITFSGTDNQSGFKKITYNIDDETEEEYNDPISLDEEGLYKISYTGYDNLDNTNTNNILCLVDNSGPELYHRFSINSEKTKSVEGKEIPSYPRHTILFLSATDHYVGVDKLYYSLNDSETKLYRSLIEGFNGKTLYKLNMVGYDKLGNKNEKTTQFYID
ncbi:MAG: OmpL47-type beta-barrel domain-containing protein [Bacteroidota bacterium]